MRVVVVGAGVMGAWTARWLRRGGHAVTLVDRHGSGNRLGSSGDESEYMAALVTGAAATAADLAAPDDRSPSNARAAQSSFRTSGHEPAEVPQGARPIL